MYGKGICLIHLRFFAILVHAVAKNRKLTQKNKNWQTLKNEKKARQSTVVKTSKKSLVYH
jgi:hypothetical protein